MDPPGPRPRQTHDSRIGYADIEKCEKHPLPSSYAPLPTPGSHSDGKAGHGIPSDYYKAPSDGFLEPERTWKQALSDMLLLRRYPSWALPAILTFCLVLLTWPLTTPSRALDPPRKSTGYSDVVQWDNYTLWIHDQRVFLQCVPRV